MDLNPINVLADNKAAPSSANASPAKHSFADVLSAQPQSVDHRPPADTKTTQPHSDRENKPPSRKHKSGEDQSPNQNEPAVDPRALANLATAIPTAPLALSLFGIDPTLAADSVKAEDLSASQDGADAPLTKPALLPQSPAPDSTSETATLCPVPKVTTPQPHLSAVGVAVSAADALPFERPAAESLRPSATGTEPAGKPGASQDATPTNVEQNAIKPTLSPAPSHVATPVSLTLGHNTAPKEQVSANEPAANTIATSPSASSDPSLSALASAAEKIGAVVSATVHSTTPKSIAARPVSALKAAIAPGKVAASPLPQVSEIGATRPGEPDRRPNNSEKRDPGPTLLDQNPTTDSKAAVDETPKEAIAASTTTVKDGANSAPSTVGSPAAAPQLKNGAPSWPAGSNVPEGQAHQDAASIALNRANVLAGMELSGLSKTSMIERFRQSELHFGMQSGEFGHIEVRTLLDHHEVTARISVEHGDLSRALEAELPGLQKKLSDLDVPTARITLHEQSAAMSGESGRRSRGQEWSGWQPSQTSNIEPQKTVAALLEPAISTEGLSIRI